MISFYVPHCIRIAISRDAGDAATTGLVAVDLASDRACMDENSAKDLVTVD